MAEKQEKTYTSAEVKNRKTSALVRGVLIGTLATLAVGVVVKKTTKANIIDGAEKAVDGATKKIGGAVKGAIDKHKAHKDAV
jgi:hypothetical protein